MRPYNYNSSNDLISTPRGSYGKAYTWSGGLNSSGVHLCALVLILAVCVGLLGCGTSSSSSSSGKGSVPTITAFTANPTSINSGTSSALSWASAGAPSLAITPGTFTSTSPTGQTATTP